MTSHQFFADDPVDGSGDSPDLLGRKRFARDVTALLERVRAQSESSILALFGPWGAGKSSVLQMILSLVKGREWTTAEFNPWGYADLDSLLAGFLRELYATLPKSERPGGARESFGRFIIEMSTLGKVGGLVGVDLEGAFKTAGGKVLGDQSISARKKSAAQALRKAKTPILVVLDDLDRLAPAELLLVFKLVRLVGRLPYVHYLLSYDEQTLLDVLARTELCADNEGRARDYLEKIVQVRIDLPPLRRQQAEELLFAGLKAVATDSATPVAAEVWARLHSTYEAGLRYRPITPRAINRYLAHLDALYGVLGGEVNFHDFALVTYVRTFEPKLYAALADAKEALTIAGEWRARAGEPAPANRWRSQLPSLGVAPDAVDATMAVLGELFPLVGQTGRSAIPVEAAARLAAEQSISHTDYFDRYFGFAVPDDDLPDAAVAAMIRALPATNRDDSIRRTLVDHLSTDTARTIRKLETQRRHGDASTDHALVLLLAQAYSTLADTSDDNDGSRADLERLAVTILRERPGALASLANDLAAASTAALLLMARAVAAGGGVDDPSALAQQIAATLARYQHLPFVEIESDALALLIAWQAIDEQRCREWLQANAAIGAWRVLDVAAALVTTKQLPDGTEVLDEINLFLLDRLLGLDYVMNVLAQELSKAAEELQTPAVDTPENRRRAVLAVLRRSQRHGKTSSG